jgi:probable HAF family extracellular repeat protein
MKSKRLFLYAILSFIFIISNSAYAYWNITDLGTLGGTTSRPWGINASGQVVGYSYTTGNTVYHAFLYSGSTMTDLGTLGGTNSKAWGINASGQIVGEAYIGSGTNHAFLYSGSTMTDLGTLGGNFSMAQNINASGQVVGDSNTTGEATRHAFLYSGSTMIDLNTLIDPALGWTLERATAINDSGQIVGYGYNSDMQEHAFLLVPEPISALIFGVGAIFVIRKRRK